MVIVHILHDLHELPPKFNVSLRVKNKIKKKKTNNQCAVCVKKKKKKIWVVSLAPPTLFRYSTRANLTKKRKKEIKKSMTVCMCALWQFDCCTFL